MDIKMRIKKLIVLGISMLAMLGTLVISTPASADYYHHHHHHHHHHHGLTIRL